MNTRLLGTAALVLACTSAPVAAQFVQRESLTNWIHAGTAPDWTDDVPDTGSVHGIVDQLNASATLQYFGSSPTLTPGTYVAAARLSKIQDQVGVADIEFFALLGTQAPLVMLAAADQPTGAWVRTPYLVFTVTSTQQVSFILQNVDPNVTKQNYRFDEITLGRIDLGSSIHYESMTRWGHAWGGDPRYFTGLVPDLDSAAGHSEQLLQVWWLEFLPIPVALPPGLYTANVRLRKTSSTAGASDLDLEVRLASGPARVRLLAADQPVGEYVYTPDLVFMVGPNDTPSFWFGNTSGSLKQNYQFDALVVRKGAYTKYGAGCSTSLGPVDLIGSTPAPGELFSARVGNVPATAVAAFVAFGAQRLNLDLTPAGLPGCWMLASLEALLPVAPNATGIATGNLTIPNIPALAGSRFYNQAIVLELGANPLGVVSSNGGFAEFGN